MSMLENIFSKFSGKNKYKDNRAYYILYKIVDKILTNNIFILQCINTKATFYSNLSGIIFDIDILYSLHPIQACYIGIEYAKSINHVNSFFSQNKGNEKKINKYPITRYGKYTLLFQDREKKICFLDEANNKELLMDPVDIALSKELIQEFDAAQSFYIGLLAGLKINNVRKKTDTLNKLQQPIKLGLIVNKNFNANKQI